jgi:hypothetical protein
MVFVCMGEALLILDNATSATPDSRVDLHTSATKCMGFAIGGRHCVTETNFFSSYQEGPSIISPFARVYQHTHVVIILCQRAPLSLESLEVVCRV